MPHLSADAVERLLRGEGCQLQVLSLQCFAKKAILILHNGTIKFKARINDIETFKPKANDIVHLKAQILEDDIPLRVDNIQLLQPFSKPLYCTKLITLAQYMKRQRQLGKQQRKNSPMMKKQQLILKKEIKNRKSQEKRNIFKSVGSDILELDEYEDQSQTAPESASHIFSLKRKQQINFPNKPRQIESSSPSTISSISLPIIDKQLFKSYQPISIRNGQIQVDKDEQMVFKDLYERMVYFKVRVRVCYIRTHLSARLQRYAKLVIMDKNGDHMQCLQHGYEEGSLKINCCYDISQGQIVKKDQEQEILLYKRSEIQEITTKKRLIPPFMEKSFVNLQEIFLSNYKSSRLVSIVAVFVSTRSSSIRGDDRINIIGLVSDLFSKKTIHLSIQLYLDQKLPEKNSICLFYNLKIVRSNGIIRLESTNLTYFRDETKSTQPYFQKLQNALKHIDTDSLSKKYTNLSQGKYIQRSIQDVTEVLRGQCNALELSLLRVQIKQVTEKMCFKGCGTCHRKVVRNGSKLNYCHHCKKLIEPQRIRILKITFSDGTGQMSCQAFEHNINHIEGLNKTGQEFILKLKSSKIMMETKHMLASLWKVY